MHGLIESWAMTDDGELLGHDLLSPRLFLTDEAQSTDLDPADVPIGGARQDHPGKAGSSRSSLGDFRTFVQKLLAQSSGSGGEVLLSPTDEGRDRPFSTLGTPATMKDAIDHAILRSNLSSGTRRANRFEIARNGQRVATITLTRSAYRLGETVMAAVDLAGAEVPCYTFRATLETVETVHPSLALRSTASVQRATRRTYATHSESTLFAQRLVCVFGIPLQATPAFFTSGVSLDWSLQVDFVTPQLQGQGGAQADDLDEADGVPKAAQLLEEIAADERAITLAAVPTLPCESFAVTIPLRVYGPVSDDVGLDLSAREGSNV